MACIVCSGSSRKETVLGKPFYLCAKHSAMVEDDRQVLIELARKVIIKLVEPQYFKRRNALYDLIETLKLVDTNG